MPCPAKLVELGIKNPLSREVAASADGVCKSGITDATDKIRMARMIKRKQTVKTDLRTIPGVGPSIEQDLLRLGIKRVTELHGQDPQALYDRFCMIEGRNVDRCLLYVFRCAVYFASEKRHDPEKLKWWNWKD